MHVKILIQKKLYLFLSYLEAKLCGSCVDIKPCERERYSDERVTKLRMRDKKKRGAGGGGGGYVFQIGGRGRVMCCIKILTHHCWVKFMQ
jgi:hypothetical protein